MGTFPSAHPRDPGAAWLSVLCGEGGLGGQQNSTLMLKPGPGRGPGHQPAHLTTEAPTAAPASLLLWGHTPCGHAQAVTSPTLSALSPHLAGTRVKCGTLTQPRGQEEARVSQVQRERSWGAQSPAQNMPPPRPVDPSPSTSTSTPQCHQARSLLPYDRAPACFTSHLTSCCASCCFPLGGSPSSSGGFFHRCPRLGRQPLCCATSRALRSAAPPFLGSSLRAGLGQAQNRCREAGTPSCRRPTYGHRGRL